MRYLPSRALTYPPKGTFGDDVPFPQVGYVSSLEGISQHRHGCQDESSRIEWTDRIDAIRKKLEPGGLSRRTWEGSRRFKT